MTCIFLSTGTADEVNRVCRFVGRVSPYHQLEACEIPLSAIIPNLLTSVAPSHIPLHTQFRAISALPSEVLLIGSKNQRAAFMKRLKHIEATPRSLYVQRSPSAAGSLRMILGDGKVAHKFFEDSSLVEIGSFYAGNCSSTLWTSLPSAATPSKRSNPFTVGLGADRQDKALA